MVKAMAETGSSHANSQSLAIKQKASSFAWDAAIESPVII